MLTYVRTAWQNSAPAVSEDQVAAALAPEASSGAQLFAAKCSTCHQSAGQGTDVFPPLAGNPVVAAADPSAMIAVIVNGRTGPLTVNGKTFNGQMPTWKGQLTTQHCGGRHIHSRLLGEQCLAGDGARSRRRRRTRLSPSRGFDLREELRRLSLGQRSRRNRSRTRGKPARQRCESDRDVDHDLARPKSHAVMARTTRSERHRGGRNLRALLVGQQCGPRNGTGRHGDQVDFADVSYRRMSVTFRTAPARSTPSSNRVPGVFPTRATRSAHE